MVRKSPRADPFDPLLATPASPAKEPEHSGEQAEVASVVAETQTGAQIVVAAYRSTGAHKFPESNVDDFVYSTDGSNSVIVRDGASIGGYAYSLTGGITWTVPSVGKIYPKVSTYPLRPGVDVYGDPIAVLWGDPAIMAGFKNHRLVALANLAISRQGFDANKQMDGALHEFPSAKSYIDSGCVAVSHSGGQFFEALYCIRPSDIGAQGSDQTAVGIDQQDRIFLAFDDPANQQIDLFQIFTLTINGQLQVFFNQLVVDAQMGFASHAPRIVRDQDGELWLAASDRPTKDVRLCHIRPAPSRFASGGCDFVGQVTTRAKPFPVLVNSNVGSVRTGVIVSFGANRVISSEPSVLPYTDFYFAYHRGGTDTALHIGATACRLRPTIIQNSFSCADVDAWGTGTGDPQELQPAMEVTATLDGSSVNVQYAFYQTDAADIMPGHARVKRAVLHGSPFGGPSPSVTFEDLMPFRDPAVCTAKGYGLGPYWGDFFGFRFVPAVSDSILPPRHLAIYSSDDREGCPSLLQTNWFQGRQLHVVSWSWND